MTKTNFDIDSFVLSMTNQAKNAVPRDVSQETKDYIANTIDNYLHLAYDALSNDSKLSLNENEYIFLLQILTEWVFHKTIDLSRGSVPIEYWDSVLQKIAFTIFEIEKQAFVKKLEENVLLQTVEVHVKKIYEKELQELFDNKKITKEIYEAAIAESNIDKMVANEREKIKIKHESFKKDFGFKKLTTFITDLLQYFKTKKDLDSALTEIKDLRKQMQDLTNPDKQFERLGVDILRLEVGADLLCIADPDQDAKLLANIAALRQQLTDELGYIIPNFRIMDSAELEELEYRISVREEVVAFGYVYPNKYMVNADEWDSQVEEIPENAIVSVEPTKCAQCYWIDKEDVEKYPSIVADKPEDVIIKHLKLLVIKYVDSILTGADVKKYLITADLQEEALMETILERIELEDIRRIFVSLIREQVSIKDIEFVLTRLNYYSKTIKDPIELTEMLRVDLAQQITMKHADKDRNLWVVEFDEKYTKYLESNVKNTINGQIFDIPQEQINELIEKTATKLMVAHQSIGMEPVVLCSPKFRQALYSILVKYIPTVVVMSHAEVAQTVKVVTQEIV